MKYAIFGMMIAIALGLYGFGHSTNITSVNHKRAVVIEEKMLWGRWRSNVDKKAVLVFKPYICIDYYGRRIIDTLRYRLGKSCNISDASKKVSLFNAYLIYYNDDSKFKECNEILNLDKTTLSYRNDASGKIHEFSRILTSSP